MQSYLIRQVDMPLNNSAGGLAFPATSLYSISRYAAIAFPRPFPSRWQKQLNDAYDALKEAHRIGRRRGWDAVPWPALLERLFAVTNRA